MNGGNVDTPQKIAYSTDDRELSSHFERITNRLLEFDESLVAIDIES